MNKVITSRRDWVNESVQCDSRRQIGKSKIALVISQMGSGGAERVMSILAVYWAARAAKVVLISTNDEKEADFYVVPSNVSRMKLACGGSRNSVIEKIASNCRTVHRLRRALRTVNPDVVISFMTETNIVAILANRGLRGKLIISERIDASAAKQLVPVPWRVLRRFCYPWADYAVAQTDLMNSWLADITRKPAFTIPNPVVAPKLEARARQKTLLSVGRLADQKGHDLLICAFKKTLGQFPDWKLKIVGEGPNLNSLRRLCVEQQIDHCVSFLGKVQNIFELYSEAGIFVLSSRFEGFPNALLEAMAMGCPSIATDCKSGPSDIVTHGVNGLLVETGNIDSIAAGLATLMANEGLRGNISKEATKVREEYSVESVMNLWNGLVCRSDFGLHPAT